jgi:hypothetical protein
LLMHLKGCNVTQLTVPGQNAASIFSKFLPGNMILENSWSLTATFLPEEYAPDKFVHSCPHKAPYF